MVGFSGVYFDGREVAEQVSPVRQGPSPNRQPHPAIWSTGEASWKSKGVPTSV